MKRLYYLTDSLEFAQQVSRQLFRVAGFSPAHLRVLTGEGRCTMHSKSPRLSCDLRRGAKWGAVLSGAAALLALLTTELDLGWGVVSVLMASFAGALLMGFGEYRRNRRFSESLQSGMILMMVDVRPDEELPVRALLAHLPIRPVSALALASSLQALPS